MTDFDLAFAEFDAEPTDPFELEVERLFDNATLPLTDRSAVQRLESTPWETMQNERRNDLHA